MCERSCTHLLITPYVLFVYLTGEKAYASVKRLLKNLSGPEVDAVCLGLDILAKQMAVIALASEVIGTEPA
ncbi:MAG: hypothetical protein ACJ74Z_05955 [Bryobacteraceae bacterium]